MTAEREISPREAARAYGRADIAVLPLHYIRKDGRCSCNEDCGANAGKHPWTKHGSHDATADDRQICAWWDADPNLNVGIAPGKRGRGTWIAVDVDKGERIRNRKMVVLDGPADLRELEREFGVEIPQMVMQESGSGARHVLLMIPDGWELPGKLSKALDVIGPGKYIVAAPSNHKSGKNYRWINPNFFDRAAFVFDRIPDAPAWMNGFDPERRARRERRDDGDNDLRKLAKKTDLTPEEFESAVMSIPNKGLDVDYDTYMNVLFAIHFEMDGSEEGRDLAHKWAELSDKYIPGDVDHRWDSIYDQKGSTKTGKYIIMKAMDHGWEPTANLLDWQKAIRRINKTHAYVTFGAEARVLKEVLHQDRIVDVEYLKLQTLTTNFLPETYMYPSPTEKDPDRLKPKDIGTIWLNNKKRREYERVAFEPDSSKARKDDYNLYRGLTMAPAKLKDPYSACSMLVDHIYDVIAGGNEEHARWIIAWFAQIAQQPWKKLGTSLVLIGSEGAGKSIVGAAMKAILGAHHIIADNPNHILGNFNSALATAIFVQMEEAFWAGDKRAEGALKHLITGASIRLEPKGVDAREIRNYARIMITTNQPWAVPAGLDARRFAVFRVLDTVAQDRAHFKRLVGQLEAGGYAAWLQYLMETDLSKIDVGVAPRTAALLDQKLASLSFIQSFVVELLDPDGDMHERVWKKPGEPAEIETAEFIGIAEQFYKSRNYRWPNTPLFVSELRKLLPPTNYRPGGNEKRRYRFGTLTESREIINTALGQRLFT